MKKFKSINSKKAFTIVELVIVIAVIAILAAVLIPTFSSIVQKAEESRRLQQLVNKQKEDFIESMLGKDDSTPTPEDDGYVIFEFTHFDVIHYRIKIKPGTYDLDEGYDELFEVERWINEADVSKIPEDYFRKELSTDINFNATGYQDFGRSPMNNCHFLPGYDKSESGVPERVLNDIFAKFAEYAKKNNVVSDQSGFLTFASQVWGENVAQNGNLEYSNFASDSKKLLSCTLVVSDDGKYTLTLALIGEELQ